MPKGIDVEQTIKEILEQTNEDRKIAREFLDDLKKGITSPDDHVIKGPIAKEYMKAMNKSTDQMIKMAELALKYSDDQDGHTIEGIREMIESIDNASEEEIKDDGD